MKNSLAIGLFGFRALPARLSLLRWFLFLSAFLVIEIQSQSLKPWAQNPWYWEYQGKPVLLVGGSDDDNLFQWPRERLIEQLDRISSAGGNYIRNTMSDRKDRGFELYPFKEIAKGHYDLDQWNDDYWERFETMLRETAKRSIFVQIEIWDRFDYTDSGGSNRWQIHPYNPKNNVNYTFATSGFAKNYPDHPGANKQPFFYTTPDQRNNVIVLKYQRKFVDKMLDISLRYDHVLYCMDNETKAQPEWGAYWAGIVKSRANQEGKQVFVTEMWDDWNLKAERHRQTFDHPELYGFVDVSQNNHNSGRKHWDNFLYVKNYLSKLPRPINTTKTYGATGNKFGHTDQDAIERIWRHLLGGAASVRFHRPDSGLGIHEKAVACIQAVRWVEKEVPFWDLSPALDRIHTLEPNQAYAASWDERALVVFFTGQHEVTLKSHDPSANRTIQWIHVDSGLKDSSYRYEGGIQTYLKPPGKGNWVAVIREKK